MFREMRRNRQQMSDDECREILNGGTSGVLAVLGDEGYPYAVPMSYVFDGADIYFHCAVTGHKLDAVRRCDKSSFCVIGCDEVIPEKYTTRYKSVIVFGRVSEVKSPADRETAARLLGKKYHPGGSEEQLDREIEGSGAAMAVLKLNIEYMTGKMGKEFL